MTFFFVSSLISTNGNLTEGLHIPSKDAAYFTGDGLLSINKDECKGWSNLSNAEAFFKSSWQAFWKSEASLAATLAVTPIAPTPPRLLNYNALSSFPVNWINSLPIVFNCLSTRLKSPVASLTPTIFFNSYNLAIVSTSISITDLEGIL